MAGEASSGAFIRVPSFSCWQNSSLICTPGYGEAPGNRNGGVRGWEAGNCYSAQFPKLLRTGHHGGCSSCSSWGGLGKALPCPRAVWHCPA